MEEWTWCIIRKLFRWINSSFRWVLGQILRFRWKFRRPPEHWGGNVFSVLSIPPTCWDDRNSFSTFCKHTFKWRWSTGVGIIQKQLHEQTLFTTFEGFWLFWKSRREPWGRRCHKLQQACSIWPLNLFRSSHPVRKEIWIIYQICLQSEHKKSRPLVLNLQLDVDGENWAQPYPAPVDSMLTSWQSNSLLINTKGSA